MSRVFTHNLGFPRIGSNRELKNATEKYWQGKITKEELFQAGAQIRKDNWETQKRKGIDLIPSNDFSFYDQMLDMVALVGAVPPRFDWPSPASASAAGALVDLDTYFAMARGLQEKNSSHQEEKVFALEMLKWLDTNYHYMVPEFLPTTQFSLASTKVFDEFSEASALGIVTKPVLIGPLTFLLLGKEKAEFDKISVLLPRLLLVYAEVIRRLAALGARFIQFDEPVLTKDVSPNHRQAFKTAYAEIAAAASGTDTKLILATYFDDLGTNLDLVFDLPVHVLHVDLTRGEPDLDALLTRASAATKGNPEKVLSLGVVDGRNIWKVKLDEAATFVHRALAVLPVDRVWIGPSCSLIHSPISLDAEKKLPASLLSVLAFANEKLDEIAALSKLVQGGSTTEIEENTVTWQSFLALPALNKTEVRDRLKNLKPSDFSRQSPFPVRKAAQQRILNLPPFPTTTIGSLPQTSEVRAARLKFRKGELSAADYDIFIQEKIKEAIRLQEELGIDVLVTGEFERTDMVEYFGVKLDGFAFTENAWVQSFGSRYVKPPILYGDISRPSPMTVRENQWAQALTKKPVKGMLTGPLTILQWSFVRKDQPRRDTAFQIALAIRDEVVDLAESGSSIVQIDEPALREGLPLRRSRWAEYLQWSSEAFRLATTGVKDEIQIHTHMCYAEFSDIINAILGLDADVISIESSRSQMKLLPVFANPQFRYTNQIGPGVFDIHSPKIPTVAEMIVLLQEAARVIEPDLIWVNPDCGLKTRQWPEVRQQLSNMVQAALALRADLPIGK